MYVIKVEVRDSVIHGKGVFTLEKVPKGKVVWQYTPAHDQRISIEEFKKLPKSEKNEFRHSGYLSPSSNLWVCPPKGDPACYTNHSNSNNLATVLDAKISDEPYFVANRDIKAGEELTDNYLEFDKISQKLKVDWLNT